MASGYPGSTSSVTATAVPAISPGGNQGSRDGGIGGHLAGLGDTQYSDLGSSYKSGVVSGGPAPTDTTPVHVKATSKVNITSEQQKRVSTYIRQRELSNFLRRDEN